MQTSQSKQPVSRYDSYTMASETMPPSFAPAPPATRFATAHRVLHDAIAARAFPGCAYGVVADGRVVMEGALGAFTYDQPSMPLTPHTVYDGASLTKVAATTAAAMLL